MLVILGMPEMNRQESTCNPNDPILKYSIFLQWMRLNATRALTMADSLGVVDQCFNSDMLQTIYGKSEQSAAEGAISFL